MANEGNNYLPPDNLPTGPLADPVGMFKFPAPDKRPTDQGGEKAPESTAPRPHAELVKWALEQMSQARPVAARWRRQASECDRFKAGKQFSNADLRALERDGRPSAVFNAAQKWIRFITGLEEQAEVEIRFLPRDEFSDPQTSAADLVTSAYDWVIQNCDGDSERSTAFEDMIVRGMGWTYVSLSRSDDVRGLIRLERIDGYEMLWDRNSEKKNLADARWVARERQVPIREAMVRWPKYVSAIRSNRGSVYDQDKPGESTLINEKEAVPVNEADWPAVRPGMVKVTEFQFRDDVMGIYFYDPIEDKDDWMSEVEFNRYRTKYRLAAARFREIAKDPSTDYNDQERAQMLALPEDIVTIDRVVMAQYKTMLLIGDTIISSNSDGKEGPIDLPGQGFTFNCMTGQYDDEDKIFYGFFKILVDPQRYMTKYANQIMEILTRSSKGGAFVETDAVDNVNQFADEYAKAGNISWLEPGALLGGKVQEKAPAQLPKGAVEMFNVCMTMLREVSGLDPESQMGMGLGDRAAQTMRQQQVAGLILLSQEFSNLARYRRAEARTIFDFLKFVADDRWIRIGGPYDSRSLQLIRDPFYLEYEVLFDEGNRDPNMRAQYWAQIVQMAPTMMRMGMWLPEFFDFSPYPARVKAQLKQAMKQQAEQRRQLAEEGVSEAGRGKPQSRNEVKLRERKLAADAALTEAKAAKEVASLDTEEQQNLFKTLLEGEKLRLEKEKTETNARTEVIGDVTDIFAALANHKTNLDVEKIRQAAKSSEDKE